MKRSDVIIFLLLALVLVLVVFLFTRSKEQNIGNIDFKTHATLDDVALTLGVASTSDERRIGLSGQNSLAPNHGLLFAFDKPGFYGIWMKDMNFAIDVIWFDEKNRIVFIKNNFLPQSYPNIVTPPSLALNIIEVPAGFVEEHQIRLGDQIEFSDKTP